MTATAVLPRSPAGRSAVVARPVEPEPTRAVAYQRVLLHHHRVERDLVWPALRRTLPDDRALPDDEELTARLADWTSSCARIDHQLRDLATAARQWAVAATCTARDGFAMACLDLADAVDAQTAREEELLHRRRWAWRAVGSGRYRAAVVRPRGAPPAL